MEPVHEQAIAYLRGEMGTADREAFEDRLTRSAELRLEVDRSREILDLLAAASEESVIGSVKRIIEEAIRKQASDIHLEVSAAASDSPVQVKIRVDGALRPLESLPLSMHRPVVDRWKMLADCDLRVRRASQMGRIPVMVDDRHFDLRVTFLPCVSGERVTVRILAGEGKPPRLEDLRFSPDQSSALRKLITRPSGLIGVTGPAGCGKETLALSLVSEILELTKGTASIYTVQDTIEYYVAGVSQVTVDRQAGLTHLEALRSIFRSDLDVVYVDSVPDAETAHQLLQMAATGHLVVALMQASSALTGIQELLRLGDPLMVAQNLVAMMSQRLLLRQCDHCLVDDGPPETVLRRLGLSKPSGNYRKSAGCEKCSGRGHHGRRAVIEILEVDDSLRDLIAENPSLEELQIASFHPSAPPLPQRIRRWVAEGITSAADADRALFTYRPRTQPDAT